MIRSTFAGFTTAQLGMAASQRALDVTGQNIANINTIGYTRQRLDIASLNTRGGELYNQDNAIKVGFGVEMTGVSQLRDPFLDAQYRSQMSKLGTTDAQVAGFEQLTDIFDETVVEGVRAALISITTALDQYGKQVGNQEFDTMVRSNMQILLNLFHDNATRLQDVRDNAGQGLKTTDVPDLNKLLENIANLNRNIKNSHVLGNPALELMDERNNLLDELSSYLPITTQYSEQEIGPGQSVEILDVVFTDTNGAKHYLVSDGDYGSFDTDISPDSATLTLFDSKGNIGFDVTEILGDGTLKGTLDFLNKKGDFDGTDFKGVGYYEEALDSLVNVFANVFNNLNQQPRLQLDANGDPLRDADGKVIPELDGNGNLIFDPAPLFETTDGRVDGNGNPVFTASNIKIAEDWINGTYRLTTSTVLTADGTIGSSANDNLLRMIDALSSDQAFSANGVQFFKGSFYNCFANIESTLGVDKKSGETTLKNRMAVLNETSNSRDAISGVQLDEECMNLMHYNQSYTAAARLMTTLDEALDTLINRTGVVGR